MALILGILLMLGLSLVLVAHYWTEKDLQLKYLTQKVSTATRSTTVRRKKGVSNIQPWNFRRHRDNYIGRSKSKKAESHDEAAQSMRDSTEAFHSLHRTSSKGWNSLAPARPRLHLRDHRNGPRVKYEVPPDAPTGWENPLSHQEMRAAELARAQRSPREKKEI